VGINAHKQNKKDSSCAKTVPSQSCSTITNHAPSTHPQPHHPTTEEPSSFSFSRPIERAQCCLGRCRGIVQGITHKAVGQKLKHDTTQRLLPTPTKLHCTIGPNTTQIKASNSCNNCAEFTHDTHKVALYHWPKHNTNKKAGNSCNDCVEFTHEPTKVTLHPGPNTTQTKAGNGHNDCVEFIYPRTHKSTIQTKGRQRPQRLRGIYCTHAHEVMLHPPQTQHKQKPAAAAMILWNLPTHPQSHAAPLPQTKYNSTNKSQQWPQ